MRHWTGTLKHFTSYQIEHRLVHRDGKIVWVIVAIAPDMDETGSCRGYYGTRTYNTHRMNFSTSYRVLHIVVDISDRKRMEAERLELVARAEAEQRHRAEEAELDRKHQEMFIGMISFCYSPCLVLPILSFHWGFFVDMICHEIRVCDSLLRSLCL